MYCTEQNFGMGKYWRIGKIKEKCRDKRKICREEVMNNVNSNYRRILKLFGSLLMGQLNPELRIELKH